MPSLSVVEQTALDNAMVGTGRDQQADNTDHKPERDPSKIPGIRRKPIVAVAKHAAELEPEQYLCAEDQHARLVEGDFDLPGQVHA